MTARQWICNSEMSHNRPTFSGKKTTFYLWIFKVTLFENTSCVFIMEILLITDFFLLTPWFPLNAGSSLTVLIFYATVFQINKFSSRHFSEIWQLFHISFLWQFLNQPSRNRDCKTRQLWQSTHGVWTFCKSHFEVVYCCCSWFWSILEMYLQM